MTEEKNVIADKYGLLFIGKQRIYKHTLEEYSFNLEYTTPYSLSIGGHLIENRKWGDLLFRIVSYLLEIFPTNNQKLFTFSVKWTKASIFFNTKKINSIKITPNLYLNGNHTALHSCWLLIDLLKYFEIDIKQCCLYIKRPSKVEPIEVREMIKMNFLKGFSNYLTNNLLYSEESICKILKSFETLNKLYQSYINTGYDDIFLFDNLNTFNTYKSKFLQYYKTNSISDQNYTVARKLFNILSDYYKYEGY